MKNKFFILVVILLGLTGCSAYNISNKDCEEIINIVLNGHGAKTNTALEGYQIYLPRSVEIVDDAGSNNILYSDQEKYYLYVDLVSYYQKAFNEYFDQQSNTTFFAKELSYNGKKGYVIITKESDEYLIKILYNYAKIEVRTKDYKKTLAQSLLILNSVTYQDKIIESLVGNNILSYDEEPFNLTGPSNSTTNFLKYEEDFGYVTEEELPDEDKIIIQNSEQ